MSRSGPLMAEVAVTVLVFLLVLGGVQIPALGDAIGKRLRRPAPRPKPQREPSGPLARAGRVGSR
jgi:hypothetical protein